MDQTVYDAAIVAKLSQKGEEVYAFALQNLDAQARAAFIGSVLVPSRVEEAGTVRSVIVQLVGLLRPEIYGGIIDALQERHDALAAEDLPGQPEAGQ